jgi:hypothetical protein
MASPILKKNSKASNGEPSQVNIRKQGNIDAFFNQDNIALKRYSSKRTRQTRSRSASPLRQTITNQKETMNYDSDYSEAKRRREDSIDSSDDESTKTWEPQEEESFLHNTPDEVATSQSISLSTSQTAIHVVRLPLPCDLGGPDVIDARGGAHLVQQAVERIARHHMNVVSIQEDLFENPASPGGTSTQGTNPQIDQC